MDSAFKQPVVGMSGESFPFDYGRSGTFLICPGTENAMLSELAQSGTCKNAADPAAISAWCRSVDELCDDIVRATERAGWTRNPVPKVNECKRRLTVDPEKDSVFRARLEDWLPFVLYTMKDSSLGAWRKTFAPCTTKMEVWEKLTTGTSRERASILLAFSRFLEGIDRAHVWMHDPVNSSGVGMPVYVYPKNDDGMRISKLLKGQHRSIGMPDWTVLVIETALCSWAHEGSIRTWDDACALMAYPMTKGTPHMTSLFVGMDPLDCKEVFKDWTNSHEYDVAKWDRSLPRPVVEQVYASMMPGVPANVATCLAGGLCGSGTYVLPGGRCVVLPNGSTLWCSGALKTLSGNSIAHAALHKLHGWESVVMGDDAAVKIKDGCPSTADVEREMLAVGLKIKDGVIRHERNVAFCGLDFRIPEDDKGSVVGVVRAGKRLNRSSARRGPFELSGVTMGLLDVLRKGSTIVDLKGLDGNLKAQVLDGLHDLTCELEVTPPATH